MDAGTGSADYHAFIQAQNAANQGTTWGGTTPEWDAYQAHIGAPLDMRNYMYGRAPGAADAAANQALATGQSANATGQQMYGQDIGFRNQALKRGANSQQFAPQTGAIGQAQNYAYQLGNLENQQGPSAAQAQLQAGTNAAMANNIAMARSGRGFGGGGAAAGLAQGQQAQIFGNNVNAAAQLRASEDAAWRQRQAGNYANAAGINLGAGTQFGQQVAQNDQSALGWQGLGQQGYFQGVGADFTGQGVANQVRGMEMQGGQAADDRLLRAWAAQNGFNLQADAAAAQRNAALIQGGATLAGGLIGSFGGPAGTAAGAAGGAAVGKAVTS